MAFSPTLCCFSSPSSLLPARMPMFTAKFYYSPISVFHSGKHIQYPSSKFAHCTSRRNALHDSSHPPENGVLLQANSATQMVETTVDETEFVEVGYISNVHGLRGELRVKPSTDFPEQRFMKPGVRWLRVQRSGVLTIHKFELVAGRSHSGQQSWLITLKGIDTVEEAKELVGATLLVKDDDRPILAEDEFYVRDLIGMSVILKETGELVGTVVDIFNTGCSDIMRVMLNPVKCSPDETSVSVLVGEKTAPLIYIPFAKEIVPDVDLQRRQLQITPPEGLLELNLRPEGLSNREKRQQARKQRRKIKEKIAGIKKKLHRMRQEHILAGLSIGDKVQKHALLDQILGIDFKLLQRAVQDSSKAYERYDLSRFINVELTRKHWQSLENFRNGHIKGDKTEFMDMDTLQLYREGLELIGQGQTAVMLLVDEENGWEGDGTNDFIDAQGISAVQNLFQLQADRLLKIEKLANLGSAERFSVPLIVVTSEDTVQSVKLHFENQSYFGLKEEQVWFLSQENLPCVSCSSEEAAKNKILMASPWKIIQAPTGLGGIFSSLADESILERLTERGIRYIQMCNLYDFTIVGDPTFFGFVHKQEAHIGLKLFAQEIHGQCEQPANITHIEVEPDRESYEVAKKSTGLASEGARLFTTGIYEGNPCCDMILSMEYLEKLTKQIYELEYHTQNKQISYVKEENKKWVEIYPESPNAYQLRCSIYSSLKFCPPNKVALSMYH